MEALGLFVRRITTQRIASKRWKSFVGCGDTDHSIVSPMPRRAELRIAETRAIDPPFNMGWEAVYG
jgi:hypothetical protein